MKIAATLDVIVDTSPLQYLHQLGVLDVLGRLYGRVVVPQAVADEIQEGIRSGVSLPRLEDIAWIEIRTPEIRSVPLRVPTELGKGERELLALALEGSDCLAVMDDKLARRYAQLLGIRLTGTLGVLLRAKEMGMISLLGPFLDRLDALDFRMHQTTRELLLSLAGEADWLRIP